MARSGVNLQGDFSELAVATGSVTGMANKVRTQKFASDLVKYTHSVMADRFDRFIDAQFLGSGRKALHHVYEWKTPPDSPDAKLWRHILLGHGGNRVATWDWKASKKPIPSIDDRAADEDDPMSVVPQKNLDFMSRERHWFHWKAPVMESGNPVIIQPKNGKRIVYPTGDPARPLRWATEVVVKNPGGAATTGAFSKRWAGWWSSEAPRVFSEVIAPEAEVEISNAVRKAARTRTKTVGVSAVTDYHALMESGERWAEANIERYQRKWRLRERRNGK